MHRRTQSGVSRVRPLEKPASHSAECFLCFLEGIRHLKYDNCGNLGQTGPIHTYQRYAKMRDALDGTNITFAMCQWYVSSAHSSFEAVLTLASSPGEKMVFGTMAASWPIPIVSRVTSATLSTDTTTGALAR